MSYLRRHGLAIDPGMSNGMCLFEYSDEEPFKIVRLWQIPFGAVGLRQWMRSVDLRVDPVSPVTMRDREAGTLIELDLLIVEKFTPRPDEKFNLTLDAVEPLRGEGVLIANDFEDEIVWREPSQQYFIGAPDLGKVERRRLAEEFLETHGLKPTGKDVKAKDADDAISAILHSISYLRKNHRPTQLALFPPPKGMS
jgi:hypothetical protein